MSRESWESYVEQLGSAGESVESNAEFTLNPADLGSRFAKFQEDNPAYCFLRLFQGLFRAGASEVAFTLERKVITLRVRSFSSAHPDWINPEALLYQLGQPKGWDRTLNHVCTGLLSATAASTLEYSWGWGQKRLTFRNREFALEDCDPTDGLVFQLEKNSDSWLPSTSEEHATLGQRLSRAGTSVSLDGRELRPAPLSDSVRRFYEKPWYHGLSDDFVLAHLFIGQRAPTKFRELEDGFGLTCDPQWPGVFSHYLEPSAGRQADLTLDPGFNFAGRVYPIIDGVIGEPAYLKETQGMVAYFPSDDELTDLSGLELLDPDEWCRVAVPHYWDLMQKSLFHLRHVAARWRRKTDIGKIAGFSIYFAEAALVIGPVLAGVGAVAAGVEGLIFAATRSRYSRKLQDCLRVRLESEMTKRRT